VSRQRRSLWFDAPILLVVSELIRTEIKSRTSHNVVQRIRFEIREWPKRVSCCKVVADQCDLTTVGAPGHWQLEKSINSVWVAFFTPQG